MFRPLLAVFLCLFLVGCCCKPRTCCNPCQDRCNPCPKPCEPGGGGDTNCAVWATQSCDGNPLHTRAWLVQEIRALAISAGQNSVVNHCNQYLQDKNCKGNTNEGGGDCAPIGVSNCQCLLDAWNAAQTPDWAACTSRLMQGH